MCAKVKKQVFKGKPLPLNQFHSAVPDVLLAYIFSFLAPKDLYRVGSVCKWWKLLLLDESIWRDAFEKIFKGSPPMRLSSSWRLEYLSRVESIRNLEFSRLHVTDIDSRLSEIDKMSVACQFRSDIPNSLSVGHIESGACSLIDIERGKFDKYVLFDSSQRQPSCLELTSTSNVAFFPVEQSHTAPISALALSDQPDNAETVFAASGSEDGIICIWDTSKPRLVRKLKGLKNATTSIKLNENFVLAIDSVNSLFLWKLSVDPERTPTSCGQLVKSVDFLSSGIKAILLFESGGLEQLDLNTLERKTLSADPMCCYHLNPRFPQFAAIAGPEAVTLLETDTVNSRTFQVRHTSLSPRAIPHAIYFDDIKLVGFFEDDVVRIWCITSKRQIRKIGIRGYIPRRLFAANTHPLKIVSASNSRLMVAVRKSIVVIGVGNESAHLATKPKRTWKHKVKAHGSVHQAVKETLLDLEEEDQLNAKTRSKFKKLQDLSDLTEEEVLQYALTLSADNNSSASENQFLENFNALNLTEEEAINYAIFLSQESQE
ncbi:F-box/LRR-repeat protein 12 [Entomophthora muscae]|uniref:F-box/LRR-repeat protein 12 n=1 Tax=Entomophthora muscae TaxID=34485 RepID=A0ACC2RPW6_9FUNG|nr:F-box/LRR-repeat protein 12 [Entomophthora muscae]